MKDWIVSLLEPFYYNVFMPWFERSGFILYGGGGKGDGAPDVDPRIAQYAAEARFRPFALSTSAGRGFGNERGQFGAQASQPFRSIQQQGLAGTNQLLPSIQMMLQQQPNQFQFDSDLQQTTADIFNQQAALLQPQFAQQNAMLQQALL